MQERGIEALQTLGMAAGEAAHDLNNLWTIILGYAGMLLRSLPKTDPAYGSINEIQLAAERGRKLTRELAERYRAAFPPAP